MAQRSSGRRNASASASRRTQRITKRLVNVRRHTKGYIVGGKKCTVAQTRNMAATGRISGVQVVGNHIQAKPGKSRLTDLPMQIVK